MGEEGRGDEGFGGDEFLDKGPRRMTDFCHADDATAG
jgi:hypothetical protein